MERGIELVGNPMSALDASGAEQPADHLGFYLVSDSCDEYVFVGHASRLLDSRRAEARASVLIAARPD